ncbi:hypothetical protein ACFV3R_09605 [Streptomyces sp. NPDC059740]|uniref:hypothetical protein n=1 Tax=Streptomyces sp. NPDC059740 TaxID=3346926 RepID=UPI00364D8D83
MLPPTGTDLPWVHPVDVTPSLARQWLEHRNRRNRRLRPRVVATYARDMSQGRWMENGETIKFASDGTLLDGQHRLEAVITSGRTVRVLVVEGLPLAAQQTMDAGARRTTGDALSLQGERGTTVLAAVLRRLWMWERGDRRLAGVAPSTSECAELLEQRPEVRASVEVAQHVRARFRHLPQSTCALAHCLFARIDRSTADWFFARLADGAELPPQHPVLTLRHRLTDEAVRPGTRSQERTLAYLIRAWNAVREGRSLARIQHAPNAPMPEPL